MNKAIANPNRQCAPKPGRAADSASKNIATWQRRLLQGKAEAPHAMAEILLVPLINRLSARLNLADRQAVMGILYFALILRRRLVKRVNDKIKKSLVRYSRCRFKLKEPPCRLCMR